MASYSSLGIGTGIDLSSMLTKIMDAERIPVKMLEAKISSTNTRISAFGTLKSKLDALQTASDNIRYETRLAAKSAALSDSAIATASATSSALTGSYTLEVTQLASAQKSFSQSYTAGTTFGPGDLNFTVAGQALPAISLQDQSQYTLQEVGARINSAKIGVNATVVTASDGSQRMILTGENTGDGNGFSITSTATPSGGQGSLANFDLAPELMRSDAKSATMKIDGISVSSSTNAFSSSLAGVTLNATKLGSSTLKIASDDDKIVASAKAFVDAYNAVVSTINANTGYNEATKSGLAFSGDFGIRSISDGLRSARMTQPAEVSTSTYKTLADLGISIGQNGSLSLDSTKLKQSLSTAPNDVVKTLNAYGKSFSEMLTTQQSSGGTFSTRVDNLNNTVKRFQSSIETLEIRISLTEKRYRAQFTALDKFVSSMQTTSSYLGQQISSLQK